MRGNVSAWGRPYRAVPLFIDAVDGGGHVKDALGQFNPLAGTLVDDLIEQLQNEIIREAGF